MEIDEIIASIEGSPSIGSAPFLEEEERIEGSNTESTSRNEGTIYYDIRFYILVNEGKTKILFDVEAQKNYYPGYKIVTRGLVYCARMISSQINQEFDLKHYDNLKKVYSIWICFNPPDYIGNAISRYHIQKEDLLTGIPDEKEVDLMCNLSEMYEERGMERGMEIGELIGKIMMCKEFGFSDEETAEKLNISVKTLRETLKKRDLQLQR